MVKNYEIITFLWINQKSTKFILQCSYKIKTRNLEKIKQSDDENRDWNYSVCRIGEGTQAKEFRWSLDTKTMQENFFSLQNH